MDKRFELFKKDLVNLNKTSNEKMELLSKLLECKSKKTGEKLSPKEKMQICHIVSIFNKAEIDFGPLENAARIGELDIKEYKKVCDLFDDDIYNAVNLINCLNGRKVAGGPAPQQVKQQMDVISKILMEY